MLTISLKVERNHTVRPWKAKAIDFMSVGQKGTLFTGRRVVQHRDYRVTVSMDEYVKAELRPIEVPQGYWSNARDVCEEMLTNIKGVNGSWLVGINGKARHGSNSLWVRSEVVSVDLEGQRGSETMSHGSDNYHDLATPFY